jgi:hypothetical protein
MYQYSKKNVSFEAKPTTIIAKKKGSPIKHTKLAEDLTGDIMARKLRYCSKTSPARNLAGGKKKVRS